jgi:mRNA interferase RelE/StbE
VKYRIEFTSGAACRIKKLLVPVRFKVLNTVAPLATDPWPRGARKLTGEDSAWRIRVGDYRVIYEINDSVLLVTVVRAGHRREVYER